jgi:hypothetical protein
MRNFVPCDTSLLSTLLAEHHDTSLAGHFGRDKTYLSLSRIFYWPRMHKTVGKYIRSCYTCQRVKASPAIRAPLQSLDVLTELWDSVSLDFIYGLPKDKRDNDGVVTFTDRCSKSIVLAAVSKHITAADTTCLSLI